MSKFTINIKNFILGLVYSKDEIDTALSGKSDTGHSHGDIYYTETEVDTLLSAKEDKSNIITSTAGWSATPSDSKYPSEKLVNDSLDDKISKSNTMGLVKNDGTIDTNTYLTEHQSLANYVEKSNTSGLIKNDGTIDTNTYLTQHQSLDSKTVTLEKQGTAESGFAATYVLKQGGSALSPKINIPKDYLVKSGSLETVGATPSSEETDAGLDTGDKYLLFVVNTQENDDATDIIIPVEDLIDVYTADNTTLQLSNSQFSIKSGGVGSTQLASNAVTTAKITDANVTRAKLASAVTDELDSKLEASDIDVSWDSTEGILEIEIA